MQPPLLYAVLEDGAKKESHELNRKKEEALHEEFRGLLENTKRNIHAVIDDLRTRLDMLYDMYHGKRELPEVEQTLIQTHQGIHQTMWNVMRHPVVTCLQPDLEKSAFRLYDCWETREDIAHADLGDLGKKLFICDKAIQLLKIQTDCTESESLTRPSAHVRWMIRRDMAEVMAVEEESFEYSWTEEDFLRCLRQRNNIGMVADVGDRVVGFMIYELHKAKLHLLNFAVHPYWRRQGVGTQMVQQLISKLSSHRRTRISLEVRETNLNAQLFFRKQELRATKVLRNFYEDSGEDAFLMEYRFGENWDEEIEEEVSWMDDSIEM
jgi:ribosomal-protein-alanine N-acetyltransferase